MRSVIKKCAMSLAVASALAAPSVALATNGSFLIGFGAAEGNGGAAVAFPQDAMVAGANPAGIADVGTRLDVAATLFFPHRCAGEVGLFDGSPDANGNALCQRSGVSMLLIPGMGFTWSFDDNLTIGMAGLGAGGGNTTYDNPNFFSRGGGTKYLGVDLVQLIVPITAAWKFNDTHTLGFSIVPGRQRFLLQGAQAFFSYSKNPDYITNKGHDYADGMGMRIGWLGHFMDNKLMLGATYASKVFMRKFEHYKGLFAGDGSFDVPANCALGIAFKATPEVTVAFDYEKILNSEVPAIGNPGPTNILYSGAPIYDSATHPLGSADGIGFGWTDQTVYKLGVVYQYDDKWTFRAGLNYGKSPVPDSQILFSTLAPAIVEKHVTFGMTYNLGEQSILGFGSEGAVSFAYVKAFRKRQQASLLFDNTTPVTAVAEMDIDSLTFGYTLKF